MAGPGVDGVNTSVSQPSSANPPKKRRLLGQSRSLFHYFSVGIFPRGISPQTAANKTQSFWRPRLGHCLVHGVRGHPALLVGVLDALSTLGDSSDELSNPGILQEVSIPSMFKPKPD